MSTVYERMSHTPGPWTTERAPHRAWIASVGHNSADPQIWTEKQCAPGERYQYGDKQADAYLIAAAPELLKAAMRALNVLKAQGETVQPGNVLGALDAAIRKAEGRS